MSSNTINLIYEYLINNDPNFVKFVESNKNKSTQEIANAVLKNKHYNNGIKNTKVY